MGLSAKDIHEMGLIALEKAHLARVEREKVLEDRARLLRIEENQMKILAALQDLQTKVQGKTNGMGWGQ